MASFDYKKLPRLYEAHGSLKAVGRATDTSYKGVHYAYTKAVAEGLMDALPRGRKTNAHMAKVVKGKLRARKEDEVKSMPVIEGTLRATTVHPLPLKKKGITRFLFTSAQNNTPLFDHFWDNLLAFRKHVNAQLCVSMFFYVKSGLGARGDKKAWLEGNEEYKKSKDIWFDPRIMPFIENDAREVAPGLTFRGDSNISPTKMNPLSSKEAFTGRASGIFPHPKFAMQSVATVNTEEPTKFNYTTGTVTMRNYIARDAGLMAEFHHCYGALLVEVDEDGNWWVRQINADSEGTFYEIDPKGDGALRVHNGKITTGHRIEALNAGDNHAEDADLEVFEATWGGGGLVDTLRPKYQFFNDVVSFNARGHHEIKDPYKQFLYHKKGLDDVRANMGTVLKYLELTTRPWCRNIIVDSNHDRHVARWLKEQDGRRDPPNAQFWFDLNKRCYDFMARVGGEPNHLQEALLMLDPKLEKRLRITFLPADGSFIICHDKGGGIECGLHGDRGPNGARGSARALSKMGRKANIGHSHSACIVDGVYQSGTSSKLKLSYNVGPSSWSHSHIVTYPNGKRCIITVWRGKWRA